MTGFEKSPVPRRDIDEPGKGSDSQSGSERSSPEVAQLFYRSVKLWFAWLDYVERTGGPEILSFEGFSDTIPNISDFIRFAGDLVEKFPVLRRTASGTIEMQITEAERGKRMLVSRFSLLVKPEENEVRRAWDWLSTESDSRLDFVLSEEGISVGRRRKDQRRSPTLEKMRDTFGKNPKLAAELCDAMIDGLLFPVLGPEGMRQFRRYGYFYFSHEEYDRKLADSIAKASNRLDQAYRDPKTTPGYFTIVE